MGKFKFPRGKRKYTEHLDVTLSPDWRQSVDGHRLTTKVADGKRP
jgi:hypothetical protein